MKKKLFVILLGALSAVTLWAYNPLTGLPVSTGEVVLGEWNRNYPETLAMADSTHIPMVLVWASSECSNCQYFEQTVLASAEFKAWMAERQLIMSFGYDKGTQYGSSAAKAMAKNKSGKFPYVLVYWNKGDGSATVEGRFSGLSDWLPVRNAGSFIKNTIASIEQYIAEYTPGPGYTGGVFALSDSEGSHLEAAAGKTSTVYVPLWRTNDVSEAATNYLEFDNAAKAKTRVTVKWAANEASKTVAINVPAAQAGKSFTLTLFDEDGSTEVATSSIAVVADPGNSVTNPYFVGEKSADELGFGEWTMDIDVATAKVAAAAGDAYTLLLFTGPLWCPDCIGAEEMFNSAEFIGWAADNQVALVEIDQALSGQDKPTLLGYGELRGKSGAAYLSRKGIDPADAQEVFARNVELSLQPPYTRAWTTARNPNPHAVLLRKDGTVAGRWNINEDADRTTHFNKNIWQLKDLLLLAEDGDETTMYAYTTGLTYAINTIADTSLQVNENKRVYKLTGDLVGKRVKFTAEPATVEIAVLASADPTNFTQNVISSAAGELTVDFDGENTAGDVFVQLTAYPDGCTEVFSATTVEDVQLTSSMIIVPAEKSASYDLEDGETELTVETEKDAAYKLDGFGDVSAYFDYNPDDEVYTAKVTGTVTLPVAGTSVTYQKWVPGTVGFTKEADQFIELDGAGSFTVSRSGGSSGALKVKVSLAEASERVVWGGDAVFEWADGESGEKSFEFEIVVNDEYEGETVLPFNLEVTEGAATVGIAAEAVTIYDRDEPTTSPKSFEESFFKGFTISQVYPIHNIRENPRRVTIKKASGTLPPGMTMKYDSKQQAMVFSGVPKAMGTYEFSYNITETRSDGAHTTTDPIAFAVEIRDPSDVNQFFGTSWNREVPVIDDEDHIAGMLTVTATKSNKVTAKFSGTESAPTQFSGGWSDLDEVSGTITASLKTRTGARLDITLSNTGEFSANIEGVENYFENLSCSAKIAGAADDMSAYKGYYTVQLPCADPDDVAVANGVGYLTLTFTSASAVKTGKVNYSGMLPNGQTVSGTASLSPSADMASLAIFRRAGHDVLGVVLDIAPNAATTYSSNPQVIIASEDFEPYWLYRNGEIEELAELEAFGGYYNPNDLLSDCCETIYLTNEFLLDTTSGPALAGSDKFGTVIGAAREMVVVTANKIALSQRSSQISLTLNKRTGVFSGSAYVGGAIGRVRAQYKGVLLPGWHDCGCYDFEGEFIERPLGAGTIYFTDKVGNLSVKRGLPVTIGLPEE